LSATQCIERLTIIGVGLIGGSLARALRGVGYCGEIIGAGRDPGRLQVAAELGVIDRFDTDLARAVTGADMVLVSVPLGAMRALFGRIATHLDDAAVLTDAGSAKGCVVDDARAAFGDVPARFVPGHPIAGTERSGVEASFAELFDGRRVILTPLAETEKDARDRVARMWEAAGALVEDMGVHHHDAVLAATSHLPHLLAYSLVSTLASMDDRAEIFRFAAGGFRDFTRIASSDPQMWHDICVANRVPLLDALATFNRDLGELSDAVSRADGARVLELFERAKFARDNLYRDRHDDG
jgi:prephenate dehydrogenase